MSAQPDEWTFCAGRSAVAHERTPMVDGVCPVCGERETWPDCEAIGCDSPADWAFIGEGGDLYLCVFHGGREPVERWTWIGAEPREGFA